MRSGLWSARKQAIEVKELATLVVSGGSTPLGFLRLLAQQQLPWSQVLVTLADERWVPVQHADSNERMVREQLIDHTGAQFLSLRGVESSSAEAQRRLQEQMLGNDQFEVVILGMGTDGYSPKPLIWRDSSGRIVPRLDPVTAESINCLRSCSTVRLPHPING